jgi:hypothetical protein
MPRLSPASVYLSLSSFLLAATLLPSSSPLLLPEPDANGLVHMPMAWKAKHHGVDSAARAGARQRRLSRRRDRRRLNDVPFDEVPIFGSFEDLGYYYVDIFVGTPPQHATVIFDTGSGLTAFPCTGCADCGKHINPKFDTSKSSTCQRIGSSCVL